MLWGSVDQELARADKLILAGNSRVRLVVYSDGEDSDKSPVVNHRTLINRYRHIIDRQLQLDWVTLGFDLNPQIKSELESTGRSVYETTDAAARRIQSVGLTDSCG